MKKYLAKWLAQLITRSGLLQTLERLEARQTNRLRILAYHRIGDPEPERGIKPPLFEATPAQFAQQMRFLARNYHAVSVQELLSALSSGQPLPPRSVMVTFDDGYRDFLDCAWPILQSLRIPTTLFVATGYLSERRRLFWWDELHYAFTRTQRQELHLPAVGDWSLRTPEQRNKALTEIKRYIKQINHHQAMSVVEEILETLEVFPDANGTLLTWQDLRHLSAAGLYVGAHTRTHPLLSRVTLSEARQEIVGSQQDLYRELDQTWPIFAYPSGHPADLRPELPTILHEAGFQVAMTLIEGHNALGRTHPLHLKRVGMATHLSTAEFRLILTGVYDIYGLWRKLRSAKS